MSYYRVSKTKAREFAQKMSEIQDFCFINDIYYSKTKDSYYFTLNDINYRVSNHTNRSTLYPISKNEVCIFASKTRIREIYKALREGKKVDKRGHIINE